MRVSALQFTAVKCTEVFFSLTFEVPFNGLFASTFQSRMSNIFRDSESLGKSNVKKWSYIWTFLFESGLKSPRNFFFFFLLILPWSTLLWHRCYYPQRSRDALSPVCGIFDLKISTRTNIMKSKLKQYFKISWLIDSESHTRGGEYWLKMSGP